MDGHAFCSLAYPVLGISCSGWTGPNRCCMEQISSHWSGLNFQMIFVCGHDSSDKSRRPDMRSKSSFSGLNTRERERERKGVLALGRKMTKTLSAFKIKMQMSISIPFWVTKSIYCWLTDVQCWILHFLKLVQASLILVLNIAGVPLSTSGWFVCLYY